MNKNTLIALHISANSLKNSDSFLKQKFTIFMLHCSVVLFFLFFATIVAAQSSEGAKIGLGAAHDPLNLDSSVALVADVNTHEVLFAKNPHVALPIASITKIMTVLVTLKANLDLDEYITLTKEDYDYYKHTGSRLKAGDTFTRRDLIHLALMSSENRAAAALGRTYPGGLTAMVATMNAVASQLGMFSTSFVETTGLSEENRSTANDLARLVMHAAKYPIIKEFSTSPQFSVRAKRGVLDFKTTNKLVRDGQWEILLQKTGYINEAGRCLVMQARIAGRDLVIVLLDSINSGSRFKDANTIRTHIASLR